MVGRPTVVKVIIEKNEIPALLDTGATVSTISSSLVDQLGLQISPTLERLHIECANGQQLPYVGCVVADVSILDSESKSCLLLVVQDNTHTQTVPLLLGTNNLEQLIPQNITLPDNLHMVSSCLQQRKKYLKQHDGSIATLKYVGREAKFLPSGCTVTLNAGLGQHFDFPPAHTIVEPSALSSLSDDIEISP